MQPDPTSPLDLDALKALCDAATPGPWEARDKYPYLVIQGSGNAGDEDFYIISANLASKPDADAAFIAAAHEAVPALLAALAEAQRELADTQHHYREVLRIEADARADAERMREVFDAAKAFRIALDTADEDDWGDEPYLSLTQHLCAAVDTYETQEGTDG